MSTLKPHASRLGGCLGGRGESGKGVESVRTLDHSSGHSSGRVPHRWPDVQGSGHAFHWPSSPSPHSGRGGVPTLIRPTPGPESFAVSSANVPPEIRSPRHDVPQDVVSNRADVSPDVLDQHYDERSAKVRMEQRWEYLNIADYGRSRIFLISGPSR